MLLHPDPLTYWPLFGTNSIPSFLLGPRKGGVEGNEALYKAVQKINNNKDFRNLDQTTEKMFSYFRTGGNQKREALNVPENIIPSLDAMLEKLGEMDERWTSNLASIETGSKAVAPEALEGFNLTRMKMWCPYLSSEKIWREEMQRGNSPKFYIELIRRLEFSEAKSIQLALSQLETASTEQQAQNSMNLLTASTLLFVAACADADLDFAEGNSVIEWFLPRVEDGKIVPPLRNWVMYAKKILGVETRQETTDILLSFQSGGDSRNREGKRLWEFGGKYNPLKSKSEELYLPSNDQFTKMTVAASKYVETHRPENAQYVNDLKTCSVFVIFLSKFYEKLAELNLDREQMMVFNDYPYFYKIAQSTKGPPPRIPGDGQF